MSSSSNPSDPNVEGALARWYAAYLMFVEEFKSCPFRESVHMLPCDPREMDDAASVEWVLLGGDVQARYERYVMNINK